MLKKKALIITKNGKKKMVTIKSQSVSFLIAMLSLLFAQDIQHVEYSLDRNRAFSVGLFAEVVSYGLFN